MLGRNFPTPSAEERPVGAPAPPALASIGAVARSPSAALPFGAIFYLLSLGLVAAATVGVFFGLGLYLLAHRPAPDAIAPGS